VACREFEFFNQFSGPKSYIDKLREVIDSLKTSGLVWFPWIVQVAIVYAGVYSKTILYSCASCKVRDVWKWLNCMHVDTSEGGAVMSRCGFRGRGEGEGRRGRGQEREGQW